MSIRKLLPAAVLAVHCAPALAEPPDTLVVTAARTPLSASEIGASVTVIDRDEIERRQSRYVADLLRGVPGFNVSTSGGLGAQTQLRVRGAEANHLLVLVDGIEINDPASGDEVRLELLSSADVERIEIVRGPQSALWGSDAIGGVINIITRAAPAAPEARLRGELGGDDTRNAGARLAGRLGDWSLSLTADRLDTDGINVARAGDERDGATLTTIGLGARYAPSDDVSIDFGLRHADGESDFDAIDFFVTGLPVDADRVSVAKRTYATAALSYRPDGGRLTHRVRAGLTDTDNDSLADGVSSGRSGAGRLNVGYQLDVAFANDVLSLAVDHEDTDFEQRGQVIFGDPNQDRSMRATGFVAEYVGRAFDPVTWSVSARFDRNSDFDDATSGRAMLAWDVADTTTLRASVAEGRKNPTFTERFGFFADLFLGNPDLQPESSIAYELGLEQRLFDDRLTLDVAVFRQLLDDEIDGFVFDPSTGLFTAANRDGRSERRGAELVAAASIAEGLELSAAYTYLDASEPDGSGGRRDELRRPRHQGQLGVRFTGWNDRLDLALTGDYGGTRLDRFFPPFPGEARDVTLGGYWLFDLAARFSVSDNLAITARLTNLLDDDYEHVFGFSTPGRVAYVGFESALGFGGAGR